MENPISVDIINSIQESRCSTLSQPSHSNFAISGLPWHIRTNNQGILSIQEMEFLENHLQLVELMAFEEIEIQLTVHSPNVFLVIVMEGFFKYYHNDMLSFYGMGNCMYMAYIPQTILHLKANKGKHSILVLALEKNWLQPAPRPYPQISSLPAALASNSSEIIMLPMCAVKEPAKTLWTSMLRVRTNLMVHQIKLGNNIVQLIEYYHEQLQQGKILKKQLHVETANTIFEYIHTNLFIDSKLTLENMAYDIGISVWKLREYSDLLLGQSIHKYVRDLRMLNAKWLLETSNFPVGKIAIMTGYSNLPYFYQTFRQYFEVSPNLYRKTIRKKI
ncbi:MAG: helix-turn-helix transcriptional regulator [Sphingobacterium sp.]|jgi:AraC-like DNA-binding protein|nr:helix-turn-helix transcriptional regulator [Sphingobacterium sp.]